MPGGTNDFQPFAGAGGANVITQAQYLALAAKATGFQSGLAVAQQVNKVWRQSSIVASMIGQFIVDFAPGTTNAVDDGTITTLEANFLASIQAVNQIKLTSNLNLYVNPSTGNDTNNGTGPTTAFRTIQRAFDVGYGNYNYNRNQLIVNLAAGTYTAGVSIYGLPTGCPLVQLIGNVASPATVQINVTTANCILANGGCNLTVSGVTLTASGSGTGVIGVGYGIVCSQGWVTVANCVIGACGTIQISATNGGVVVITTTTFTGTSNFGLYAQTNGLIWCNSTTLTYTSAVYTGANANAVTGGILTSVGTLFAGSATGVRFTANNGGMVLTNGGGVNFWPGNAAGVVTGATFGIYS